MNEQKYASDRVQLDAYRPGDELEVQGEYDPLSDICYADGLCYSRV